MKMTGLEKRLVNRNQKARRNIVHLEDGLKHMNVASLHDVLEIGCGMGSISAYVAQEFGMRVIGTDCDEAQVKLARRKYPETHHLHFRVEDAGHLSFADESFDLVLSQNVFHHIPRWRLAVRELFRVLRPEGYVIWFDLAVPGWAKRLLKPIGGHHGLYTIDDVDLAFDEYSFTCLARGEHRQGPLIHHQLVFQKSGRPENEMQGAS